MLVGLAAEHCICFFMENQINQWYLSNNEVSRHHIYVNDSHREKLCFTQSNCQNSICSVDIVSIRNKRLLWHYLLLLSALNIMRGRGKAWFFIAFAAFHFYSIYSIHLYLKTSCFIFTLQFQMIVFPLLISLFVCFFFVFFRTPHPPTPFRA